MIRKIQTICLFIILGILQVTFMPYLAIHTVWPNIILVIAVLLLLLDSFNDALLLAGIGGIIEDLTGKIPMGLNTIFLIGLIILLKITSRKFFPETNTIIVFVVTFTTSIIFSEFNYLILKRPPDLYLIYEGLYAAILGEIIFYFLVAKVREKNTIIKIDNL